MYIHSHAEEGLEMTYLGKNYGAPYVHDLNAFKDLLLYPTHFSGSL